MNILPHKTFPKMSAAATKRARAKAAGRPYITEEQCLEIVRLFTDGWTHKDIAEKLGVSRPFIGKLLWTRSIK